MKKSILIIMILSLPIAQSYAQDPITKMAAKDRLIIGMFTDLWSDLPADMDPQAINRGISIDYIQEFPISTSNFSVAAGFGFSSHNLYSDNLFVWDDDDDGNYHFEKIPEDQEYDNNKLSLNYLNIPLEIRYRTRNTPRTFRIHAGVKGGWLVSGHTKYKGETEPDEREIKVKEKSLDNINPFLIGVYGRIGYGRVNLNAYMSMTDIFTDNNAEGANFMSVGLSFILF